MHRFSRLLVEDKVNSKWFYVNYMSFSLVQLNMSMWMGFCSNRFVRITVNIILMFGVLMSVAACVGTKYPAPPSISDNERTSFEYKVGTGDLLNIYVWGYPDLAESVSVRPDGKITTKLIEDVSATGKTPSELARLVEQAYKTFVTNPVVTISLDTFTGSKNQQIKIVSASSATRTIPYASDLTLLDVLIEIGGLTDFANGNATILVRKFDGKSKNYSLRVDDLIRKGDITANIVMRPGDIMIIPERWF